MTHLHVDHTGGMRLLPSAEFVCTTDEWAAATGRGASLNGYVSSHPPDKSRMRLLDFAEQGTASGPFAQTIDLFDDGTISLIFTPGHTPGHMSVLLRLDDGRDLLIVGDAAYTLRSIHEQILSALTHSDDLYRQTLRELKAFADANPEATLVPSHDPDAWRQVRSPESTRTHGT